MNDYYTQKESFLKNEYIPQSSAALLCLDSLSAEKALDVSRKFYLMMFRRVNELNAIINNNLTKETI